METHAVPQEIMSVEFKLFGNFLSMREFIYIAMGLAIAYFFYILYDNRILPGILAFPSILLFGGGGTLIGLVPYEERSLDKWIMNYFTAIKSPTQRVWSKPGFNPSTMNSDNAVIVKEHIVTPPTQPKTAVFAANIPQQPKQADLSSVKADQKAALDESQIDQVFKEIESGTVTSSTPPSQTSAATMAPVQVMPSTPNASPIQITGMPAGVPADAPQVPSPQTSVPQTAVPQNLQVNSPAQPTLSPQPTQPNEPAQTPPSSPQIQGNPATPQGPDMQQTPYQQSTTPSMDNPLQQNNQPTPELTTTPAIQEPEEQPVRRLQDTPEPQPPQPQQASSVPTAEPVSPADQTLSVPHIQPGISGTSVQLATQPSVEDGQPKPSPARQLTIDDTNMDHYATTITSLENRPNTINVVVKDQNGLILPVVVCVIKNVHGDPVRASISNTLGQVINNVPLKNGVYQISLTKPGYVFPEIVRTLSGKVYPPIEVRSL